MPDFLPDGSDWPKISIVTPSYNQVNFLEETIRSVLLQGYPNLEYFIIDGGSTDGSVEIVRKYEPWLAGWVSEHDQGQADAIAKGFSRSSGKYVAWINSDDLYKPNTFEKIASVFAEYQDAALIYGGCVLLDEMNPRSPRIWAGKPCTVKELILEANTIPQPAAFIRRTALEEVGGINSNLKFVMDHELWTRLGRAGNLVHVPDTLAEFRFHPESKSVSQSIEMLLEWKGVLASSSWYRDVATEEELNEADRRLEIRIATEYMLAGDLIESAAYLKLALGEEGYPFGSLDHIVLYMSRYPGLNGQSMTPELLAEQFGKLNPIDLTTDVRRLRSSVLAYDQIERAFRCWQKKDYKGIRRHLAAALFNNPRWIRNHAVAKMGLESLIGEWAVGMLQRGLNQLRHTFPGKHDAS